MLRITKLGNLISHPRQLDTHSLLLDILRATSTVSRCRSVYIILNYSYISRTTVRGSLIGDLNS